MSVECLENKGTVQMSGTAVGKRLATEIKLWKKNFF